MGMATFDALDYFEELKDVGFTEAQAKAQVKAMQAAIKQYDESTRKELATKGDIQAVNDKISDTKHEILKWMVTLLIAQSALLVGILAFLK